MKHFNIIYVLLLLIQLCISQIKTIKMTIKIKLLGIFCVILALVPYTGSTVTRNSWSMWSDCSQSCGGGYMVRNRTCNVISSCTASENQTKRCNLHRCPDTCIQAFDSNDIKRCCYLPSTIELSGQLSHFNSCFSMNETDSKGSPSCAYRCPLDKNGTEYGICAGGVVLSSWSNWSDCSHDCFTGIKTRFRMRNTTRYLHGNTIQKKIVKEAFCNPQPCPNATTVAKRINGSMTYCFFNTSDSLSQFGECFLRNGEYQCYLDRFANETGTCDPIIGVYSDWSAWSVCSHNCFTGYQIRNRTCLNAKYGGTCLDPKTTDLQYCNSKPCYDLSNCTTAMFNGSLTCCMLGIPLNNSKSYDKCDQNIPGYSDGKYRCPLDRYGMNYGVCEPIDGKWSQWSNWTDCMKIDTCKNTIKEQHRNCSIPEYGGEPCDGPNINRTACVMENCPPDTFWSEWKLDKPCSVTCGEGKEVWKRDCMHINGNMVLESECEGMGKSTNSCKRMECPGFFLGNIGDSCSSFCDNRNLTCRWLEKAVPNDYIDQLNILNVKCSSNLNYLEIWKEEWQPAYNQSHCIGFKDVRHSRCSVYSSKPAVQRLCRCIYPGDLKYSEWSSWSACSSYCGLAYKTRTRKCISNDPSVCNEALSNNATCDLQTCPDDEGFSSWSSWSRCSVQCGAGLAHRYRICNNKILCFGHSNESKLCNTQPCKEHGNWTEWSDWSECSKSCGYGNKERTRTCTKPVPRYGGNNCTGDSKDALTCNTFNCTVDIGYTPWSIWGECSTSCGMGRKTRYRSCQGTSCTGIQLHTGPCEKEPCPVDGGWTDYTVWSPCSKTCGGGKRTKYRYCSNPEPRNGGLECDGDKSMEEECNLHICPVHGMWGIWGNWSLCDKPCNNGTRRRVRYCDSPKPLHEGRYCIGKGEMKKICNMHQCRAVSIDIFARFTNETYTDDLANRSSIAFVDLESKIRRSVIELYDNSDFPLENHVTTVNVTFFSNGSVFSNFTVNFTEISSFELIILMTSIQERSLLNSMPVNFFQINSNEIPSSPNSIDAIAINETCIRVKWSNFTSSVTAFNLTAYSVMYRDTSATSWLSVLVMPSIDETFLTRLNPYTLYTLRVTALTYDATGIPSSLFDVQTLEGVPTEPPSNTSCRASSSSVIFCSWNDVPYQAQNGIITKFLIQYRKYSDPGSLIVSSNDPWYNVSFLPTANSGTISGLEYFTRYELQIHGVTGAGVGTGKWYTVKTEEDVPSSAPLNIKAKSYYSNKFLDISWDSIPSNKWNGNPVGIILKYTVTRKASTTIVGGPIIVIEKRYDERFHRIKGLEANWEVTVTLQGKTAAGEGIKSADIVGETCRCNQKLYTAWYESNPYIFKQGNTVKGIFPDLLSSMVPQICGSCVAYGNTVVYFDRTKTGQASIRTSENDLTAMLSDDVHFNLPAGGKKEQTLYQGQYQYVNVIDSTGSVFVVVDQSKVSKTSAMFKSLASVWPLLVVSVLLMILSGILLWMVDQFENPEELIIGRFFAGSFRGFWWAFVSMTTLGYGDISPRGTYGRIIGVVWTLVGLVINGILISSISTALTVISVKQQTMLYGANVSAVYNSSQYILGIRRNANMTATGKQYLTSKEVIDALIQKKVQGALLDLNQAANMQNTISNNGLMIVKSIASTSGIGMILSGEMTSFHSKIRTYVSNNNAYITSLRNNYTKKVETPYIKARDKSVTGLFSSKSNAFKVLLKYSLYILAGAAALGLIWSYVIRIYLKRRARVHPQKSPEQFLQDYYNRWTDEIITYSEGFIKDLQENWIEMETRQGKERFKLLSKHFKKQSFGASAWLKYKSFDHRRIISKMRIEEAFLENLHKKKHKSRMLKLLDVTEKEIKTCHDEYKM